MIDKGIRDRSVLSYVYLPLLHHFGKCFRFSSRAIMFLLFELLRFDNTIDDVLNTFSP